ncbi:MAG: beta-ketoacyl synthase N-terminal-like domain-containing protein [Vicinamibacterales bacterium]
MTGLGVVAGSLTPVDRRGGYHLPESSQLALLCGGLDLSQWVTPAMGRRMSVPSKFAVAAARMAMADANLLADLAGSRTSVVMSNALGAIDVTARLLKTAILEGPEAVSPFAFTESVANAATAQMAIALQARGSNLTIVQREAGILTAVGRGAAEVAVGNADRALVGGVEEMPPLMHALLDRLEALARPGGPGGEVARPFDRRRSGFVAAEGAAVLVLEAGDQARSRGATIRGRVRGFGSAFDPSAPRIGWGSGHVQLARALRGTLDRAGLGPRDVGRIVSGASGSIAGDRLEAHTLRHAWGENPLPPILAPKGATGQYGGGFLASAMRAVSAQDCASTAGFEDPDPELGVTPHQGGPLSPAGITLVTSLASGGAAAWLLLEAM